VEPTHERALRTLDLKFPVTVEAVKARYKTLVKRHHPDVNRGDKTAEERLKRINQAYETVMNCLAS
jgi:curved DNA-binding protein CbpA